jgi:signal transduction histidine kinase
MIQWLLNKKTINQHECIEEVFFKTILVVSISGCAIGVLIDVIITSNFGSHAWLALVFVQVLLLAFYSIKKLNFQIVAVICLVTMDLLLTYRGFEHSEFKDVTSSLLISIGFICSLITRGITRRSLKLVVFVSLVTILFKDYGDVESIILVRKSIPYLIVYFIVTVASGILKDRYERNQGRLNEMVELLNQKNTKIVHQHNKLLKSYDQLSNLNESLEEKIQEKTARLEEMNKQLLELAYTNAHRVRAPLARILGLLHLIELDESKTDNYLDKINHEALQMDDIIRYVGHSIEKNISKK